MRYIHPLTCRAAMFAMTVVGCNGTSKHSEPENVVPSPNAIGSKTAISNIRSIRGPELGHLARALGGRGTVFNVWASWCGSCKGELPMLRALTTQYATKGLHLVIVSVDEPEDLSRLEELAAGFGFSPPIWVASRPLSEFKTTLAQNWKGNIPVTFLYDSKGNRRFFWDGPVEAEEITPVIEDFLSGKDVQGEKHFALIPGISNER